MNILVYETSQHSKDYYALTFAFRELGHTADVFDWTKYLYIYSRNDISAKIKDRLLFELTAKRINRDLLLKIKENNYDLFIVMRGDHILPETLSYAKTKIPVVINWSSDDIFNLKNSTKYLRECLALYDCIFSPRPQLKNEYLKKGAKDFEVIDWYYRPGLLFTNDLGSQTNFAYDVTFIGSWSKRREEIITPLVGFNSNVWGAGWQRKAKKSFLSKVSCESHINMCTMMKIFASSKINVNILTLENRDTTNLRNFEIPAARAFQLAERSNEILKIFDEDKEIVCYRSIDELVSKCNYYLKNETERKKIALNGYKRLVSSNYSIVDRVKKILSKVNSM